MSREALPSSLDSQSDDFRARVEGRITTEEYVRRLDARLRERNPYDFMRSAKPWWRLWLRHPIRETKWWWRYAR